MFYYVLDYARGCCDIFSAPEYEETFDVECMLQDKGYNLEDIEWMSNPILNYNIEGEVNMSDINDEEDLIDWEDER